MLEALEVSLLKIPLSKEETRKIVGYYQDNQQTQEEPKAALNAVMQYYRELGGTEEFFQRYMYKLAELALFIATVSHIETGE